MQLLNYVYRVHNDDKTVLTILDSEESVENYVRQFWDNGSRRIKREYAANKSLYLLEVYSTKADGRNEYRLIFIVKEGLYRFA